MRYGIVFGAFLMAVIHTPLLSALEQDYPIQPVPFTQVQFDGGLWGARLETNRNRTLPYDFQKCEETDRITNFTKAAGMMDGKHIGIYFNDSDVFKIVEGAAYCLALQPDPELDAYVDDLIAKFAGAQEADGYLYTARTIDPENPPRNVHPERWGNIKDGHELYNVGHMYEAAVAHYQATGKRNFLDVAIKNADLVDQVFGPGKREDAPGHQEIEIGLTKLYRVTGDEKYLKLAKFFLDTRGVASGHKLYGPQYQDHIPVLEQEEAVGHSVRAGYLYAGMADVAALSGDVSYIDAIGTLWENVVSKKLYLTGGIGARHQGEAFGENYELPNATAYNETCAAIANAMWNHRMFLLHGDAKYIDVLERTIYNGFLVGISLEGDTFFYPNPLETDGHHAFNHGNKLRSPWFGCSCCPANVVRFIPSLPGYAYAQRGDDLYVNLYAAGKASVKMNNTSIQLQQKTTYPWDGAITISLSPEQETTFTLNLRIPGWAQGQPIPSDLYHYQDTANDPVTLTVNNETIPLQLTKGFATINRHWKAGDTIRLNLPMPVRRVYCHEAVEENIGKVALERGPIVYCSEALDNDDNALNLQLPTDADLTPKWQRELLGGVMVLHGEAMAYHFDEENIPQAIAQPFTAVPYYAWAHRGEGAMAVWLAENDDAIRPTPPQTLESMSTITASFSHANDSVQALCDGNEPKHSNDHSIPRFTWWNHKGTMEWVEYAFPEATEVSETRIYWFDDTGQGQCRVPAHWKLYYKDGEDWKEVRKPSGYGCEKDSYNTTTFTPVTTTAIRIKVKLQEDFSGGILEWKVK